MDLKAEISKFKGQRNPNDLLDWLNTVERVFEYKDVPNDKKVKLVALKLQRYAFIWWNNVLSKRTRKRKGKIRSWRKMREKLKGNFFHPIISKTTTPSSIILDKKLRVWKSIPVSLRSLL